MATRDVVPVFWVIGNEVTEFVSSELAERAGRVVYMGLWDESEVTYLCALSPYGYVHYFSGGFFAEKELSESEYNALMWETPDDDYHDYQELTRMKGKVLCPYNPTQAEWEDMVDNIHEGDAEVAYRDLIDNILDQLSGNTVECEVAAAMGFKFVEQEQVTLISSGYDWTCPGCNKDGHVNTQETEVQCFHCGKVFQVGDVVHPEVW